VWDHARLLFDQRMASQGIHPAGAGRIERYRDLCEKGQPGEEGTGE